MKWLLLAVFLFVIGCGNKYFYVGNLSEIDDYKQMYELQDKDIKDTIKVNGGYKIHYK